MTLYTVYQPIVNINNLEILGYESLLRGAAAPPTQLFRRAKENNKLLELDSIAQNLALQGFKGSEKVFINVHPKTLEKGLTIDFNNYPYARSQIVLEITEQEMIHEKAVKATIQAIKAQGIQIAIDDFGHGFNNLSMLEWIQPNYIKLDRTLIKNIHSKTVFSLLNGLSSIALNIDAAIIAEGIETKDQIEFVKYCGITYGQGWYIGKPKRMTEIKITG